jgi:hypothetical protein
MTIARYTSDFTISSSAPLSSCIPKLDKLLSKIPVYTSSTFKLIQESFPYMHLPSIPSSTIYDINPTADCKTASN